MQCVDSGFRCAAVCVCCAAACASHPECVFVPGSAADQRPDLCVSSYFHSLTPQQVKKFTYDVAMAEPSAVGGCDGACWMRQVRAAAARADARAGTGTGRRDGSSRSLYPGSVVPLLLGVNCSPVMMHNCHGDSSETLSTVI